MAAAAACGAQARATTGQPIWTCPTTRTRSRDRWIGATHEYSELAQLLLMQGWGARFPTGPKQYRPLFLPPPLHHSPSQRPRKQQEVTEVPPPPEWRQQLDRWLDRLRYRYCASHGLAPNPASRF